jgi:hypothetical protein
MAESVESIASEFRTRAVREGGLVVLGVLAGYAVLLAVASPVVGLGFVFVCSIVLYAPVLQGRRELALHSQRGVPEERSAFSGAECPLVAMERAWSDDPETTEDGGRFSYTGFVIFRRDVRYESERTDDGVAVEVYQNDQLRTTYDVTFAETDSGTRIDATAEYVTRRHLRTVLLGRTRRRYERRVFEALGYELEGDEVDVGL